MAKEPNAYMLAVFTGILAAGGATLGTCYTAKWQATIAARERAASCRKEAYVDFLNRISRTSDSTASEFLSVGILADRGSIHGQGVKEHLADIQSRMRPQELYLRLNSDLNLLRLCASPAIRQKSDDLLSVLLGDFSAVRLEEYSADFRSNFQHWLEIRSLVLDATTDQSVSVDERISIVLASGLLQQVIMTMNAELSEDTATQ
jgi:hypothetical protein